MVEHDIAGPRSHETAREKAVRLMKSDSEVADSILTLEKSCHLDSLNLSPIELFKAACQLHGQRPALGYRPFLARDDDGIFYAPDFKTLNFNELWTQVVATASGLKRSAFLEGAAVVGICGFAEVDAVVAEFAALYLGVPCVHLDATWPPPEMERIVNEAGISCLICSAESLALMADILPHCPRVQTLLIKSIDFRDLKAADACTRTKALVCRQNRRLLVTSLKVIQDLGHDLAAVPYVLPVAERAALVTQIYELSPHSAPRVLSYHAADWADFFRAMINDEQAKFPYIALHHLPLSTIEGRGMVIRGLLMGGVSYFTAHRDLSSLAVEMRRIRPTHLAIDERLWILLKNRFDRELLALTVHATVPLPVATREQLVIEALRTDPMSERLLFATTVDASLDYETDAFVQQCLSVPVIHNAKFATPHF